AVACSRCSWGGPPEIPPWAPADLCHTGARCCWGDPRGPRCAHVASQSGAQTPRRPVDAAERSAAPSGDDATGRRLAVSRRGADRPGTATKPTCDAREPEDRLFSHADVVSTPTEYSAWLALPDAWT